MLNSLRKGEIDNAVAAKTISQRIIEKLPDAAKNSLSASAKITGYTMLNNAISGVLNGDFDLKENVNEGAATFRNMLLGTPLLELAKLPGSKNMTADYLNEIAANPEAYKEQLKTPEQKQNFEYLTQIHEALKENNNLTPEQKTKFQLLSLQQKILNDAVTKSPDKDLVRNEEKQLRAVEIEKKSLVDPDMTNKKIVQEMYDYELLPKWAMEKLENQEGKFSDAKVGELIKTIAQQANGLSENWEKIGDGRKMESLPEQLIEMANERWKDKIPKEIAANKKSINAYKDEIAAIDEMNISESEKEKLREQADRRHAQDISQQIELNPELPEGVNKVQEADEISVGEMIDKTGTFKGEKGSFYQDGQSVVFKVEGKNKEYELGNINEIKDTPISDFGITHEESVVSISDNGHINVRGKEYENNYSNPLAAINKDAEGNVVSVNLETADGKKRTFRGSIAEDIAYQINLKEINKNNETRSDFEQHLNEDAAASKEMDNGTVLEDAKKESAKNNEPVPREKVKPKPKEITNETTQESNTGNEPIPSKEESTIGEVPYEDSKGAEGEPPSEPPAEVAAEGGEGVGITHAQTADLRKEAGLPEYEKESETFSKWDARSEERREGKECRNGCRVRWASDQ